MRERLIAGMAHQLSRPEGLGGRLVGRGLNRRNATVVRAAVDAADVRPGSTAADLGFGGGLGLDLLLKDVTATGRVVGVELSETMMRVAERRFRRERSHGRIQLHPGSITDLPLLDNSVDAAITVNTIYFLDDLERAFAEVARVLRPPGHAVVGLGDPAVMAKIPFTAHGFRLRPVEAVIGALEKAGLDVSHQRVGEGDAAFHLLVATHQS